MSNDDDKRDYEVGKGRPPLHSQFKPGRSGNPKGRPKGARNLATDLAEELAERVQVREGGRQRSLSKQRALLKALFAKALQGDARAGGMIISLMAKVLKDDPQDMRDQAISPSDQAILEDFLRRNAPPQAQSGAATEAPADHD
jgi:hypothetical protein